MNENNEEKAVTSQSKSNKRHRFRPRNKSNTKSQNSTDVIGNFFAPDMLEEGNTQQEAITAQQNRNNKNHNKQNKNKSNIKN